MIGISTHVLDTSRGEPARGVRVVLHRGKDGVWSTAGEGVTDSNGRIAQLLDGPLRRGAYRLTFFIDAYYEGQDHFHPEVSIHFLVNDPSTHYHVPLLLSPYGYTTYRGS